jgi:hypothetical protein
MGEREFTAGVAAIAVSFKQTRQAGIRIVDSITVQASAQTWHASAQTAQWRCISP